jgi:hypothetical protein
MRLCYNDVPSTVLTVDQAQQLLELESVHRPPESHFELLGRINLHIQL